MFRELLRRGKEARQWLLRVPVQNSLTLMKNWMRKETTSLIQSVVDLVCQGEEKGGGCTRT